MAGMVLDGVLMFLLVCALAYGVRLEKKLSALRAGQLAFASAVTELNAAAGRAEQALANLRASGQETDLLHDRIMKAREVKAQLESLIARGPAPAAAAAPDAIEPTARPAPTLVEPIVEDDDRALRMAALAERIQGMATPAARRPAPGRADVAAIVNALTANHPAKQSLNRARRTLDEDLFAA
jgi:hypothetical protein